MRAPSAVLLLPFAFASLGVVPIARADTFTVTSADDGGAGTLREALTLANASPGSAPHTITFALTTTPAVINVQTPLPYVTVPMTIDATTQPGYVGTPLVILDGSANESMRGLLISVTQATIAGLEIRSFGYDGIAVSFSSNSTIRACHLHHNGDGISIFSSIVTVGGLSASDRNVIRDNVNNGVFASGTCNGSSVRGNYIGTNAAGTAAAPNSVGVYISADTMGVQIGPGNVISGNTSSGVFSQAGASLYVFGNLIGTDALGTSAIPNATGVSSSTTSTYIGGNTAGTRNVISGNTYGVWLDAGGGRVVGNYIGTDSTGAAALPNTWGVMVLGSSTIIGGSSPSDGNVISGNTDSGITISGTLTDVAVFNNRMGLSATGNGALGNAAAIIVNGTTGVRVGSLNAGNTIAHNGFGVRLLSGATAIIESNSIFDNAMGGIKGNVLSDTPVVTSALPGSGTISFEGTFDAEPSSIYSIEYYDNATCEAAGGGANLIATAGVLTDASGHTSLTHMFNVTVPFGRYVTAIAIDNTASNTSTFSSCRQVCNPMTFSPATLPGAMSMTSYSRALSATGGTGPYTYQVTEGELPPGLSIVNGVIVGTPTGGAFSDTVTITATDSTSCTVSKTYTVTSACPTITLSPAAIPDPTLGVPYTQTFEASGGVPPYTYTANGGLTSPLTWYPSTATIAGTVLDASPSNLFVKATDANLCEGVLQVMPTGRCPALTFSPSSLPKGEPGASYTATVSTTGASALATFSLSSGALPPGVTLAADGTLSGTLPATDTVFTFSILASAPYACTQAQSYAITVGNPVVVLPDAGVVDVPDGGTPAPSKGGCIVSHEGHATTWHFMIAVLAFTMARYALRRRRT